MLFVVVCCLLFVVCGLFVLLFEPCYLCGPCCILSVVGDACVVCRCLLFVVCGVLVVWCLLLLAVC